MSKQKKLIKVQLDLLNDVWWGDFTLQTSLSKRRTKTMQTLIKKGLVKKQWVPVYTTTRAGEDVLDAS